MQYREVILGDAAPLGIAPLPLGVLVQALAEEARLAVREPRYGARTDAVDREALAGLHRDLERRAAEPVEQQAAKRLEARVVGNAEAHQEPELALRLVVGLAGAAVKLLFEFRQRVLG